MRRALALLRRLAAPFRREKAERELAEELESHIEMHVEDGLRAGLSPQEARRQAVLRLGGLDAVKESWRDQHGLPWMENLQRDLRQGARMLRRAPGFTGAVVLTLALAIGATTSIFTVANGVLLRPLPYPNPDRLVAISATLGGAPNPFTYIADYAAFRDHNRSLSQIAGYMYFTGNFSTAREARRLTGGLATRSLFQLLAAQPALGRNFLPEEDAPGGPPAVIVSDVFWRTQLGADRGVLGHALQIDGRSYDVVGVLPAGFKLPGRHGDEYDFAVWLPFAIRGAQAAQNERALLALGRLHDGVSLEQARADLDSLQQVKLRQGRAKRILVANWQSEITGGVRRTLLLFLAAVGLLLLIACVNVANLLLARAGSRQREMAVRCSIGAGRVRLVRQLLAESVLLGLLGAALGLVFAAWGRRLLLAYLAPDLPALAPVDMDAPVLLFTLALALLTSLAFGLAPALQASRVDLSAVLKDSSRAVSEGRGARRLRGVLVAGELALATLLLSTAGLFCRSFLALGGVEGGYRPERVLCLRLTLTESRYATPARQAEFFRQALARVAQLPGVVSAAAATSPPYGMSRYGLVDLELDGKLLIPGTVDAAAVSPDYFRTLGIPLIQGRGFSAADREGAPPVALVNESFARRHCPRASCLGLRLDDWTRPADRITVVGVVRDIRLRPDDAEIAPELFRPYAQWPAPHMTLLVRTAGAPLGMVPSVQAELAQVDRTQPPYDIATLEQAAAGYLAPRRVKAVLVTVFALLALALGGVGIYGVVAYSVRCRSHELGVRLALGATRGEILALVLKGGLFLVGSGVGIGLAASLVLARLVASELWGISSSDPATLAVVALLLAATGFAASLGPSLVAARLDPMASLRAE